MVQNIRFIHVTGIITEYLKYVNEIISDSLKKKKIDIHNLTWYSQAAKVSKDLAQREIELEEDRRRQVEEETKLAEEIKKKKVEAKKRRKEELLHHETELREKILKNWKDKVVI